ncbi:MAG: polyprenyl synthetase family protein [Myxococcota bacterium]|nr:polyprenyl synthetase family protein [Myxococcota bacterium]
MTSLRHKLDSYRVEFESRLQSEFDRWEDWPETLRKATAHSLFGGGKRVRPILTFLVAASRGATAEDVFPWALAIELIHTYSLIHDDLPAMDDDDLRRGRPTCHIVFGEANAILAGDALLTQAFLTISALVKDARTSQSLVKLLANSAGGAGMVGGQIHDMSGQLSDVAQIRYMQSLKTGALITAAIEGAAILLDVEYEQQLLYRRLGNQIGSLFQITDDLLDLDEDGTDDGKNLINHLSIEQIEELRDRTADSGRATLTQINGHHDDLLNFIELIRIRTV